MGGRYVIHVLSCFGEWVQKGWWILCKWCWVVGISNYLPTSLRFPNYFPAIHRTPTTSLKCSAWWKPLCSLNPNAITTSTIPLPALLPLLLLLLLPLPPPPLCLLLLLLLLPLPPPLPRLQLQYHIRMSSHYTPLYPMSLNIAGDVAPTSGLFYS